MLDRRTFLASAAAAAATAVRAEQVNAPNRLGIVIHSYPIRSRQKGFADPLRFLEFCRERGAGGVQLPIGNRDADYTRQLRGAAEKAGMYIEGSLRTPKDRSDVERFEAELKSAKEAGATVARTVMQGGRRYEVFKTADEYRTFKEQALRSLQLAKPVVERMQMRLAVENHKDYRASELADVMKQIGSDFVGVCVDTGNNIALLEDPLDTAKVLAPWVFACHLKDMGVAESADGFLLSEVPLGEGYVDLKAIVELLKKARPAMRFSLEMITRDPLRVPCITDRYWTTFADVPGIHLARMLAMVRKQGRKELPKVSNLPEAEQLKVEDDNVRRSLEYARKHLAV